MADDSRTDYRIDSYAEALLDGRGRRAAARRGRGRAVPVRPRARGLRRAARRARPTRTCRRPAASRSSRTCSAGKATDVTVALVSMVVGVGRAATCPAIVDRLVEASAARNQRSVAEVRSAIELTDDQRARLAAALEQATGKHVEVKVIVDPTVLGGIVTQIGDTVIDGSVRHRLEPAPRDHLETRGSRDPWLSSPSTPATSPPPSRRTWPTSSPTSSCARSVASSRSATASPACRACPTSASTSCSSSRTAPSAWP